MTFVRNFKGEGSNYVHDAYLASWFGTSGRPGCGVFEKGLIMIRKEIYFHSMALFQTHITELRALGVAFNDVGEFSVAALLFRAATDLHNAADEMTSQWTAQCLTDEA